MYDLSKVDLWAIGLGELNILCGEVEFVGGIEGEVVVLLLLVQVLLELVVVQLLLLVPVTHTSHRVEPVRDIVVVHAVILL